MHWPGRIAAVAAAATAVFLTIATGCGAKAPRSAAPVQPGVSVITSTTKIADAGVLGNQRRPDESCAPQPAAPDPGPPLRPVRHAAGETQVPVEAQRIVVLSEDQLDSLCALGLQTRIVGAALPAGASTPPSYLGTVIHDVHGVGPSANPDLDAIRAANPDLILGSQAVTPGLYPALAAIAPTVFTGTPGAAWQDNLRLVGEATARAGAADGLVDGFNAFAANAGAQNDAAHFQASVVQLTENTLRVCGADTFPGSVLTDVGVDRPASQRFADKPYIEIGTGEPELAKADFSAADADIVYVSFASQAARQRAPEILMSDAWRKLSANRDNRVFVVNNEVWQTGRGIVAARGIVDDLKWLNAPIN